MHIRYTHAQRAIFLKKNKKKKLRKKRKTKSSATTSTSVESKVFCFIR